MVSAAGAIRAGVIHSPRASSTGQCPRRQIIRPISSILQPASPPITPVQWIGDSAGRFSSQRYATSERIVT